MIRSLVLLGVLASTAAAQPGGLPMKPAGGPPPTFIVLSKVDKDKKTVTFDSAATIMVPVTVKQTVMRDGMAVEIDVIQYVQESRINQVVIDVSKVKVFDVQGKQKDLDKTLESLKAGSAVLFSGNYEMVDARIAGTLKDDTVIVAHPLGSMMRFGGGGAPGVFPPPIAPPVPVPLPAPIPVPAPPVLVPPPPAIPPAPPAPPAPR